MVRHGDVLVAEGWTFGCEERSSMIVDSRALSRHTLGCCSRGCCAGSIEPGLQRRVVCGVERLSSVVQLHQQSRLETRQNVFRVTTAA